MEKRPLALLGGSFDPVHRAHLSLAGEALQHLGVERVILIPAARNPLKDNRPTASDGDRLAMLELAVGTRTDLLIDPSELEAAGPSYSGLTIRRWRERAPDQKLFWILGSDQLPDLHRWQAIGAWVQEVTFAVVPRPGHPLFHPDIPNLRLRTLAAEPLPISSTEIRRRLMARMPVDFLLPPAVLHYIHEKRLYDCTPP